MSCFHPLKGFPIGTTPNGKMDLKVVSYSVHHLEKFIDRDGEVKIIKCFDDIPDDYTPPGHLCYFTDFIEIPCGHCVGCRLEYSRQWANRLMCESLYHENNYFITLTYNDYYLNKLCKVEYKSIDDGSSHQSFSLDKSHFQKFMKRLRKAFPDSNIRYYACGEYGGHTKRPHFHAIIFGLPLDDLVLLKHNFDHDPYYVSDTLSKLWPYGYHLVCNVTWNTCAYVSRYVTKKLSASERDFYETFHLTPEFSLMSLKPGLGRQYYEDHKDEFFYGDGYIRIPGEKSVKFSPPRYYNNLFELEDPDTLADIKARRLFAAQAKRDLELDDTSLALLDYLKVKESTLANRLSSLKRGDL